MHRHTWHISGPVGEADPNRAETAVTPIPSFSRLVPHSPAGLLQTSNSCPSIHKERQFQGVIPKTQSFLKHFHMTYTIPQTAEIHRALSWPVLQAPPKLSDRSLPPHKEIHPCVRGGGMEGNFWWRPPGLKERILFNQDKHSKSK